MFLFSFFYAGVYMPLIFNVWSRLIFQVVIYKSVMWREITSYITKVITYFEPPPFL